MKHQKTKFPIIAIPAWHYDDISGTGKVLRTFLQYINLIIGFRFFIIFPNEKSQKDFSQANNEKLNVIATKSIEKKKKKIVPWLKECYSFFKDNKVDLIFYFSPDVFYELDFKSKQPAIPFISIIHDVMNITLKEYSLDPIKKWLEKRKLNQNLKATKIITVSHYSKEGIIHSLKIPFNKVEVIYNAIELYSDFSINIDLVSNNKKKHYRSEKYILYVGDMRKRKNVFSLVRAYFSLDKKLVAGYKLYLTGGGKLIDKITTIAKKHKRLDRIKFLGKVEEEKLPYIYQQADLFVFPSLEEGFGLPVIEAQRNKIAVICGKHSSLCEIAGLDNQDVLFAQVKSITDLKNKMTLLLENEALREKIAFNGYKNSLRFVPEKMMIQYTEIFQEAAQK